MFYGLDVHKRFIQVCAIDGDGERRREFRLDATATAISSFASRLTDDDAIVLEATFHSWAIWALLVPHAGRVVVANAMQVKAIAHARIKTDKIDAYILAQLLRVGFIPEVEMPSAETWELRQLISHRRFLGKQRVALRNRVRGLINARLYHCPCDKLFTPQGRRWLSAQTFTPTERLIRDSTLRLHDELDTDLAQLDEELRQRASDKLEPKIIMTVPGINVTVAIGFMSAIGDISRFGSPGKLASYFGLVPSVSQSAETCHHGHITKAGRSYARWLAIEAAQAVAMSSSPLTATYHRVRRKRGHNVAITALARKLVVLVWHMLKNKEPYRYAPISRTRYKLRRVTPGARPAKVGQVPKTLEAVYAEANLPTMSERSAGEKRAAATNRRAVTNAKKARTKKPCQTKRAQENPS